MFVLGARACVYGCRQPVGNNFLIWPGICLYEFICGAVPFGDEVDDPFEIYQEIIKSQVKYPQDLDQNAQELMNIMLNKTPELRLQGGQFCAIKSHRFFEGLNWVQFYHFCANSL